MVYSHLNPTIPVGALPFVILQVLATKDRKISKKSLKHSVSIDLNIKDPDTKNDEKIHNMKVMVRKEDTTNSNPMKARLLLIKLLFLIPSTFFPNDNDTKSY